MWLGLEPGTGWSFIFLRDSLPSSRNLDPFLSCSRSYSRHVAAHPLQHLAVRLKEIETRLINVQSFFELQNGMGKETDIITSCN
jgi:hypothetical protein